MDGDSAIDPWSSEGDTNYSRIVNKFGLQKVDSSLLPNPGLLHRRGIVFAHRDLDMVVSCIREGSPFGVPGDSARISKDPTLHSARNSC